MTFVTRVCWSFTKFDLRKKQADQLHTDVALKFLEKCTPYYVI